MVNSESIHCSHCKKEVSYHFDPIDHWRQLLFTLLSLGLWLPIWICLTFAPSKICDECGNPIWNDPPAKVRPNNAS